MATLEEKVVQRLISLGGIQEAQLAKAKALQQTKGGPLWHTLQELGLVSELEASLTLAAELHIPFLSEQALETTPEALAAVPPELARQHHLMPLAIDGRTLLLATSDPLNLATFKDIEFRTGLSVQIAVATPSDIQRAQEKSYPSGGTLSDLLKEIDVQVDTVKLIREAESEDPERVWQGGGAPPVVRLVNKLLIDAMQLRASDIHIEPMESAVLVRYRIDGLLRDIIQIPKGVHSALVSRIKIISNLDIAERRRPQDGRSKLKLNRGEIDLRISTLPTVYGEKVVIRLLGTTLGEATLASLGLSEPDLRLLQYFLTQPQGFLLVTGPTGSGKTTTLYAGLNWMRAKTKNIVTIEDPIEYQLPGVNQVQINERAGITFANVLRSILRQDPNVILVGEIRDHETAEIAIQASQTGHLVLSTLHTNDAPSAVTRLVDLKVEPFMVASALIGVVAQRLVRRVCPECAIPSDPPSLEIRDHLGLTPDRMAGMVFVRGQGCAACGDTGYRGRVAIYEILKIDDTVRSVIATGAPEGKIVQAARQGGFRSLLDDGLAKLAIGMTTAEELVRVIPRESVSVQARAAGTDLPTEPGVRPAPPVSRSLGIRKEKILVIDDSRVVLQMLRMVLGAEMFEVVEATNGAEGLELVYRESPDLIITDINMPTLDGLTFCKRLRERPQTSRIPVIMLTSQETADHEVAGLEVGADDYIPKPVDAKRLLARVKNLLRRVHRSQ